MIEPISRAEHILWCKRRARDYLAAGQLNLAVTSTLLDLRKHPETETDASPAFGMAGLMSAAAGDAEAVRRFIEGFTE